MFVHEICCSSFGSVCYAKILRVEILIQSLTFFSSVHSLLSCDFPEFNWPKWYRVSLNRLCTKEWEDHHFVKYPNVYDFQFLQCSNWFYPTRVNIVLLGTGAKFRLWKYVCSFENKADSLKMWKIKIIWSTILWIISHSVKIKTFTIYYL